LPHAHGDVGDRTDLYAFHRREDDVVESADLHAFKAMSRIGDGGEHQTVGVAARSPQQQTILKTVQGVHLADQSDVQRRTERSVGVVMMDADSDIWQAMAFCRLSHSGHDGDSAESCQQHPYHVPDKAFFLFSAVHVSCLLSYRMKYDSFKSYFHRYETIAKIRFFIVNDRHSLRFLD